MPSLRKNWPVPARRSPRSREKSGGETMAALLAELAPRGEGFLPSQLPGVKFMRSSMHVPRTPVAYEPSIVIVAQGTKFGHLGSRRYRYDANHYLVLTLPLPFECETFGKPDSPLLGLSVGLIPTVVTELVMQIEHPPTPLSPEVLPRTMEVTELDEGLANAAIRLLEALRSANDARVLGPQLVREITYRVLRGKLGTNLRAMAAPQSHFGQISRVLHRLHTDYAKPCEISTLAQEAGMSVSTFHAHFKAVTSSPPLQYVKSIRLHKAQLLMVNDGLSAAQAALAVGYESASQFSREFKRHFGASPRVAVERLRANFIRLS